MDLNKESMYAAEVPTHTVPTDSQETLHTSLFAHAHARTHCFCTVNTPDVCRHPAIPSSDAVCHPSHFFCSSFVVFEEPTDESRR